jgi:predicted DNA-binding transcriptional regulator AlpA
MSQTAQQPETATERVARLSEALRQARAEAAREQALAKAEAERRAKALVAAAQYERRQAAEHQPATPPPVLLSHADLKEHFGISYSRQHLHRLAASGKFPRPVALGPEVHARKAWRRADIEAWINELRLNDEGEAAE